MLEPIQALCPVCGSRAVVYSCTPTCCFNHVCADCRASWQQGTELMTEAPPAGLEMPDEMDDTSEAYTPCAQCGDGVFQVTGADALYCPNCRVMLRLRCTAVQPYATNS